MMAVTVLGTLQDFLTSGLLRLCQDMPGQAMRIEVDWSACHHPPGPIGGGEPMRNPMGGGEAPGSPMGRMGAARGAWTGTSPMRLKPSGGGGTGTAPPAVRGGGEGRGIASGGGDGAPGGAAIGTATSGGLAPWEEGPPSEGASARAAAVAAVGSPTAHCSTAGTVAVASATTVPPPMASASAMATVSQDTQYIDRADRPGCD